MTRMLYPGLSPEVTRPISPARVVTPAPVWRTPAAAVGNTPVLWIDQPFAPAGRGFWAKLEAFNPGGMKDRAALHMIANAKRRGALAPGAMIIESTSGTLGLGLALAGIVYGHPVTVVADPEMEPIVHRMLTAYGAKVEPVSEPAAVGGWQQARRDRVADLLAEQPGAYCPDQYDNPDNIAAYRPLALELLAQLGWVDVLVCAVSTGGHSAGIARVLREYHPHLRLVGVDAVGSAVFGQPVASRLTRGLGSSIQPRNVDYPAFDEVHWVNAAEAAWAARALAASRYVSGGWSVGAVALVAGWLAGTGDGDTRIAAVFPDGPHRYFDTVYNDTYCARHDLLGTPPPAEPDEITHPAARVVERWTRCRTVVPPPGREVRADAAGVGE